LKDIKPLIGALIAHTNNISTTINLTYSLSKTMLNIERKLGDDGDNR